MRPKQQGSSHFADNTGYPFYGLVYALVFIFDGTVIFWRVSSFLSVYYLQYAVWKIANLYPQNR